MIEINVGAKNLSPDDKQITGRIIIRPYGNPLNIISREEKKKTKNSVNFVTFVTFWLCKIPNKRSFAVFEKVTKVIWLSPSM